MSKLRDARQESQKGTENAPNEARQSDLPPLQPRPGLLVLFGILLVLLFATMLTMYFTTVYPNRNQRQSVETDQPAAPAGQK